MFNYKIIIGLNDQKSKKQEISTDQAEDMIADLLILTYGLYGGTISRCKGIYRMESTGEIIKEISIKIEISSDEEIVNIREICSTFCKIFNQESVFFEEYESNVDFIKA